MHVLKFDIQKIAHYKPEGNNVLHSKWYLMIGFQNRGGDD